MKVSFDAYRDDHGVEPICDFIEHFRRRQWPETVPLRVQRDEALMPEIQRVFDANFRVYGGAQGVAADAA